MRDKDPLLEPFAKLAFGPEAGQRLRDGLCPRCGAKRENFRDRLSEREAAISGLCQNCQDVIFP